MTARPRETGMTSLTVVADSVMHADVATTALFGLDVATIAGTLARRLSGAELARVI